MAYYSITDHEYSLNNGVTWQDCLSEWLVNEEQAIAQIPASIIGGLSIPVGFLQVRVKSLNGNPAGLKLVNTIAYGTSVIDPRNAWTNNTSFNGNSTATNDYGTGYPAQIATEKGVTINNLSISGSATRKQLYEFYNAYLINRNGVSAVEMGFNNVRIPTTTGKEARMQHILAAYKSFIVNHFATDIKFPLDGSDGAQIGVFSNGVSPANSLEQLSEWNSRTLKYRSLSERTGANYFNRASISANETISFNISAENIAILTHASDGVTNVHSRIKISVDGVDKLTYQPNNKSYLGQPEQYAPDSNFKDGVINDAIVLLGLGSGSHSVVLTFLDGGTRGTFDGVAILPDAADTNFSVEIGDMPLSSEAPNIGYNYPGYESLKSVVQESTQFLRDELPNIFPDYPIKFVETNKYFNPNDPSQINGDGIHPNTAGAENIADSWIEILP